ncbi:MAG: hypothetical protein J5635_03090 [Paludibacteraceae bacterium]|nr:hypothetical protein [Paludibacteraceae bacterium]
MKQYNPIALTFIRLKTDIIVTSGEASPLHYHQGQVGYGEFAPGRNMDMGGDYE